jgi:hypothetical protein
MDMLSSRLPVKTSLTMLGAPKSGTWKAMLVHQISKQTR